MADTPLTVLGGIDLPLGSRGDPMVGTLYVQSSTRGQPNGIATLDGSGQVQSSQLTGLTASKVSKSGDTMTGPLVLPGDPVAPLQAADKAYVDTTVSTETTRATNAEATKVARSGDTMTGALVLAADPASALQATTRQYTDRALRLAPFSKPAPFRAASWSQLFQSGHGAVTFNSGVATSNANDTTTFCKGTQSFQVVTTGTGAVASIRKTAGTIPDLTGKAIRITFRVADVTRLNQLNFQVGSATLANTFSWRVHTHTTTSQNQVQSGEWVTMTLSWADVKSATGTYTINANGTPSTKIGFTDFQFQISDDATGPVTVNLQSVEIIPDTTSVFPNGVISITFDDSYASPFTYARPKMDTLGFRGTSYNIVDVLGVAGSLTVAQMRLMQDMSGWEMAGHSYTVANHNAKYTTLSTSVVLDELRQMRAWLIDNGFHSDHFGYPGGWFGPTTDGDPIDVLAQKFWATGRGISSADNLETFPPANAFRMRSVTGIGSLAGAASPANTTKLLSAGGPLDRCQLSGDWLILTWHDIVTGAVSTTNQCSQADFNSIMDGISTRGIPVVPVGEVMRNYN